MKMLFNNGNFLLFKSLLSLFIEKCLLFQELELVCFFPNFYFDKNVTLFLICLCIVYLKPINDPLNVCPLFTNNHSLLVLGFNRKFEFYFLFSIRLQRYRQTFDHAIIWYFFITTMIKALSHHLLINLYFC